MPFFDNRATRGPQRDTISYPGKMEVKQPDALRDEMRLVIPQPRKHARNLACKDCASLVYTVADHD
jgi:hypothetical protein